MKWVYKESLFDFKLAPGDAKIINLL